MMVLLLLLAAAGGLRSTPSLGTAEARCRPDEPGPGILVTATGLKDRKGRLKLEVYPSNDRDFLADDNVLLQQGKVFRRVDQDVPAQGLVRLCIRVPRPGAYSLMLLHDRDSNHKFGLTVDGVGFGGNPRLGVTKPSAAATRVVVGSRVTPINVVMNYRQGLFSFRPIGNGR
jgi:uncharacterized protein (DUF2141 family)